MDGLIGFATIVLVLAYTAAAVWVICKRKTIAGSLGASAGFLCGAFVIVPVAQTAATVLCWAAVAAIVLAIVACIFD